MYERSLQAGRGISINKNRRPNCRLAWALRLVAVVAACLTLPCRAQAGPMGTLVAESGRVALAAVVGGCNYQLCPNEHDDPVWPECDPSDSCCDSKIPKTGGGGLHVVIGTGDVYTEV